MNAFHLTPEVWAAVVSAGAAIISIGFSFHSNSLASKALAISRRQQDAHEHGVQGYLIECFRRQASDKDIFAFSISYTNLSDLPISISRIELKLRYLNAGGQFSEVAFPLALEIPPEMKFGESVILNAPADLGARGSISGWLVFSIPKTALRGTIERYQVAALTASGQMVTVDSFLMKSLLNEPV